MQFLKWGQAFLIVVSHTQERSLLSSVLETVMSNDAWVADRNFCTLEFTSSIASKGGFFVIREHKKYPWKPLGKEKYIGDIETGKIYEKLISIVDKHAKEHTFRRIRVDSFPSVVPFH